MGHHSCCNRQKVKRGLWSPEEDEKLVNYISTYGHGCWSSVPRLAGLQRCGKSCRLRWINYLRPDLKRGSFSRQEAALIIELHRALGNKWAQIAKHLPGRTDNEVKNFWNSSIKKKMISGGGSSSSSSNQTPYDLMNNNPNNYNLMMIPNFNPPQMDHQLALHGFDPSRLMGGEMMMMMNYQPNAAPPSHVPFHQPILSNYNLPSCPSPTNQPQIIIHKQDHHNFMFGSSFDNSPNTLLLINSNQDQSYNINQDSSSILDYHPIMEPNNLNYETITESFAVPSSSSAAATQEPAPTFAEEIADGVSNFPCPPSPMSYFDNIIASFSSSTPTSFAVSADSSSSSPSSPPPCSNNLFLDDDDPSFVSIWDLQS